MKIYDCITFFNELDLLEIRLEILNDVVDYFVINEATITFQNGPKPLYYLENKERFKKFEHKIIHNIVSDTPSTNNHWDNDVYHKNCTMRALTGCSDDDIIIYSDADELLNPEVLSDVIKNKYVPNKLFVFNVDLFCYFMDARVNIPWKGSRLSNYGYLKQYSIDLFRSYNGDFWKHHADEVVYINKEDYNKPTGWHYTWFGGVEKAKLKLESFGHVEYNNDDMKNSLKYKIENLQDIIFRPGWNPNKIKLTKENTSDYVLSNMYKYRHHLCNEENINKMNKVDELLHIARMGQNSNYNSPENNLVGLLDFIQHHNLSNKNMVEIGCYLGISTELFAIFCNHITSVDLWGMDNNYDGGENPKDWWPHIENEARAKLSKYDNAVLIKDFGDNVSKNIENESLDLVYLDGNHSYESVKSDIENWLPKIKKGGFISGHDYNQTGVQKAVNEIMEIKNMNDFKVFKDTSWSLRK